MAGLEAELLHPQPGVAVLVLHGSAGPLDGDDLRESLRIAGLGQDGLVVDLARFASDDSAIAETLLDATRDGRVEGRLVAVALPSSARLADVLRTSGLARGLRLFETRELALRAVARR